MPQYHYRCDKCNHQFGIRHGMHQRVDDCPKCETEGALTRMPSPVQIKQAHQKERQDFDEGEIVKEHIHDNKEALTQEKEKLKERLFDPTKT